MESDNKKDSNIRELQPPRKFEILTQPEMSIEYFRAVEDCFEKGMGVLYDLSGITSISEETAAIMIAQIKDRSINRGRITQLRNPVNPDLKLQIFKWGIQKKVDESIHDIDPERIKITKIQNTLVLNQEAKKFVQIATKHLYGEEIRVKALYEILIECMANTNNHASGIEKPINPWFIFVFICNDSLKFIFLDLGVGLFNSLPVKQFMIKNPLKFPRLRGLKKRATELTYIFNELVSGNIKSSTGLPNRGRGLPLIKKHAETGHFKNFYILSNDGFVDVKKNTITNMNENFRGTMLSFEFQRNSSP